MCLSDLQITAVWFDLHNVPACFELELLYDDTSHEIAHCPTSSLYMADICSQHLDIGIALLASNNW